MKAATHYYSAYRNPVTRKWQGWVALHSGCDMTLTPDWYATKREAIAAIKAQHPQIHLRGLPAYDDPRFPA